MYKAYKFRMYPSIEQKSIINKTLGCTRFVYNYYLSYKQKEHQETGKSKSVYDCIKDLTRLSSDNEWLKEVDSMSLRCILFDLDNAFTKMYKEKTGYPRFKSKNNSKNNYRTNYITSEYKGTSYENIKIDLENKTIKLPKLKEVAIRGYRNKKSVHGRIINATVSKETTGKYYVSVLVEEKEAEALPKTGKIVGIDLGIKSLIVTSNKEEYDNEHILEKHEKRLAMMQRRLAKKVKGSNNYLKIKQKLSRIYSKIKNTRKYLFDYISKLLVEENDVIVTEDLDIRSMTSKDNHNLTKKILDMSWNELIRKIEYKSEWNSKIHIKVDRYYASSQICHGCGYENKEVKDLSIREWECPECNRKHNRDYNASLNILVEGLRKYVIQLGQ